ncbi:MAG: aldo/keto reductase [Acidobacteriota bacterium]
MIKTVHTRTGAQMPVLGQGTWMMGVDARRRSDEIAALRLGLDLGMTLIDTAEGYARGGAERVVAEAITGRRNEVFLVTKVSPDHASRQGTMRAAERSLKRLRTERIDLYLLHWKGPHRLEDTLAAFEQLREEGKILHYGVSNFDISDMEHAEALAAGRTIASNQVLYNLRRRGIERRLLPWCAKRGVVVMAYSPFESGRFRWGAALAKVARRHGATPAQVGLAWTVRLDGVVSIPKATNAEHIRENEAALSLSLTPEDLAELDDAYPQPSHDIRLEGA